MRNIRTIITVLLLCLPMLGMGQTRVEFDGSRLGQDYKTFTRQLKARGFTAHLERNGEDDFFYGVCKEGFFVGKYDGNAAAVLVRASKKTNTVFSVEVNLREFIDEAEAMEEAKRLVADNAARVPVCETESGGMNISMIDMPGGKKHVTRYMCYPVESLMLRFYESQQQATANDSYGNAYFSVCKNSLGHEYIINIKYYDRAAARIAEDESGKDFSWRNAE